MLKAQFKCKVEKIHLDKDEVVLSFIDNNGKVDIKSPTAQTAKINGNLILKPIAAYPLKIGSVINISVSIEDPELL